MGDGEGKPKFYRCRRKDMGNGNERPAACHRNPTRLAQQPPQGDKAAARKISAGIYHKQQPRIQHQHQDAQLSSRSARQCHIGTNKLRHTLADSAGRLEQGREGAVQREGLSRLPLRRRKDGNIRGQAVARAENRLHAADKDIEKHQRTIDPLLH